jgi:uncharacterized membrane protein
MADDDLPPPPADLGDTLRGNILALRERRRREEREAKLSDRIADRVTCFTGSMFFVGLHLLLFGSWIAVNLLPGLPHFDPSFVVLAMIASVEAIFLSTFVLISQNRMQSVADRRADLDLHINLLAEHELSKLASLVVSIADKVGVPTDDPALIEIERDVDPQDVLDALAPDAVR